MMCLALKTCQLLIKGYTLNLYTEQLNENSLDYYLRPFVQTKIKGWVRQLLWMSIYQYVYLDKVPIMRLSMKLLK